MIGQTFSHYKIIEKLGGGNMGVVYRADDLRLKRTVALKFLPPDLTRDEDSKKRFVYEAQAASALQHNNICTIHDIDQTEDGRLFICMDFYDGMTLKQKLAGGPLPAAEAIDIVVQVAEGLAQAHEAGMLHRDIKPANLMITNDGVVKIVDFGLAKLVGRTTITSTGATVGTVSYMSPEQASGGEMDQRSDIFSLGIVLYELLTGDVPFVGDHVAVVLYGILNKEPKPLADSSRQIPGGLQAIVDKMLSKDVNTRYQDAMSLRNDLLSLGTGDPSHWRAPVPPHPGRLKRAVIAAAAVVALGVASFVLLERRGGVSVEDMAVAVIDFQNLAGSDDPMISTGITGLVHVGLVENSPIRVVSPTYLYDLRRRFFGDERGPIEQDHALELARRAGATVMLWGRVTQIGADRFVLWDLVDTSDGESLAAKRVGEDNLALAADRVIAEVLPLLARVSGVAAPAPRSIVEITTDSQQAYRHFAAGVLAWEEGLPQEAVRELKQAVTIDSSFALAYLELSRSFLGSVSLEDEAMAAVYADKAWALRERLGVKDRLRLEAQRALVEDRITEILAAYREMRDRWPDDREVLRDLTQTLYWWWYHDEAASVAERGLELYPDDLRLGLVYGGSLECIGRLREALEWTRTYAGRHSESANAWDELGLRYLSLGLPDSAEAAFGQALVVDRAFFYSREGIARCAFARGDLDGAIDGYERILEQSGLFPGLRVGLVTPYGRTLGLAGLYAEAGRYRDAIRVFEDNRQYASDDPRTNTVYEIGYKRLLLRMGRYDEVSRWIRGLEKPVGYRRQWSWHDAKASIALGFLGQARSALADLELMDAEGYRKARHLILHIKAEIALAEGDPEAALTHLSGMDKQGVYIEDWLFIAWKDATARAYRMAGRLEKAEKAHRELLNVFGGHALSNYELAMIYDEMGRYAEAVTELKRFLELWSQADDDLPQIAHAERRLAALREKVRPE